MNLFLKNLTFCTYRLSYGLGNQKRSF